MMLRFAETILLLAVDDRQGGIRSLPVESMRFALAGALLMELAVVNRIDTDLQQLHLVDTRPTGDALLDETPSRLGRAGAEAKSTTQQLEALAWGMPKLEERLFEGLISRGVLRREQRWRFGLFPTQRLVMADAGPIQHVRQRLERLLRSDAIPDPDEAALVGLVDACQLFTTMFERDELERLGPRIANLAAMDLIGREVARAVREVSEVLTRALMAVSQPSALRAD
jgi:golgi phosphoprotein 3